MIKQLPFLGWTNSAKASLAFVVRVEKCKYRLKAVGLGDDAWERVALLHRTTFFDIEECTRRVISEELNKPQ